MIGSLVLKLMYDLLYTSVKKSSLFEYLVVQAPLSCPMQVKVRAHRAQKCAKQHRLELGRRLANLVPQSQAMF